MRCCCFAQSKSSTSSELTGSLLGRNDSKAMLHGYNDDHNDDSTSISAAADGSAGTGYNLTITPEEQGAIDEALVRAEVG